MIYHMIDALGEMFESGNINTRICKISLYDHFSQFFVPDLSEDCSYIRNIVCNIFVWEWKIKALQRPPTEF